RLSFIFWPLIGVQMVIQNFFQSIGKPKISIFLSLTRQMIFLLPFLLIFPGLWGINGVWLSMSVSDGLACVLSIGTLIYQYKILNARFNLKTE
ncbi:MAG: MATE family efflux transporter, partial [Muribaculaceae bacterium]